MNAVVNLASGILALLLASTGAAHPVAQGQLEIQWQANAVGIDARVSGEQILVAGALLTETAPADSLADLQRAHGHYLLRHLQVRADGALLSGTLLEVEPAENGFVLYRLSYPLARAPSTVQLRQDLLNEIAYTPGNPWEASFLVRTDTPGGEWHESLLASQNRPLILDMTTSHSSATLALQFLSQGIHHILTGYDHLLFISALVLAAATLRSLIGVIAAFTLAHSITLALSALQWVQLSSSIVEPMIAVSILTVALTNMLWPGRGDSWGHLLMTFCFGLFHGLGFAGGLLEAAGQLPKQSLALAIAGFSVGVECGHLVVVIPLFLLLRTLRSMLAIELDVDQSARAMEQVGSAFISLAGAFYLAVALP
jgi:hydrogenase/urease accessory protein HupE